MLIEALIDKLRKNIFAKRCFRIMPSIKQSRDKKRAYIVLPVKCLSASVRVIVTVTVNLSWSLSSQVTVFTCPLNALSSMNPSSGCLFDQARRGRHILIKFCPIAPGKKINEANEIRKMEVNKSEWSQVLSCLRRKKPPNKSSEPE